MEHLKALLTATKDTSTVPPTSTYELSWNVLSKGFAFAIAHPHCVGLANMIWEYAWELKVRINKLSK